MTVSVSESMITSTSSTCVYLDKGGNASEVDSLLKLDETVIWGSVYDK